VGFYDEMAEMVTELLQPDADGGLGQGEVTLSRITTAPGANEWTPGVETTATYELNAVVSSVADKFVDGTTIFATDRMVTCNVPEIEILPGDILSIDGKPVMIVKTMRMPAAGVAVAWRIIVRG
jgi:hypothetical protein